MARLDPGQKELLWLRRVRDLSHYLANEKDVRKLLPMVLDAAIELTEAERGFLVRVKGRKPDGGFKFRVEVARGFDKASLQGSQAHVSRTVVKRVVETDTRGVVGTDEGQDKDILEVSSVQARRVRSIVCVPMRLRGETRGVLYLDHRFTTNAFTESDLPILNTFADQAALALETAELQVKAQAGEDSREQALDEEEADLIALREAEKQAALLGVGDLTGKSRVRLGQLVGGSKAMQELYAEIERAARSWDPVLILGESGCGKELVAREIHARGSFPREPFLTENCAAHDDTALASTLFGHVAGSFPGASEDRQGLFVLAGVGTLFLDGVSEMSLELQGMLLRVLHENKVRPIGSDRDQEVRCRVLAATSKDLRALVAAGRFREDLYYRLDVLRIHVPALRQRPEDIPLLLEHFMEQAGRAPLKLSPKAAKLLRSYSWPGNVRELSNEGRRLASSGVTTVSAKHLSIEIQEGRGVARAGGNMAGKTLGDVERQMVEAAMRDCGGNKSRAARQLGIPRTTLYHLLERYGLA